MALVCSERSALNELMNTTSIIFYFISSQSFSWWDDIFDFATSAHEGMSSVNKAARENLLLTKNLIKFFV